MAQKGKKTVLKRVAAPKSMVVKRKQHKFTTKPTPGPHKLAIPLGLALQQLRLADTMKEARYIIKEGKVLIDGKVAKNLRYPLGFMDVLTIPSTDRYYRVLYSARGALKLTEIEKTNSAFKLCKILDKRILSGNQVQLNLHDGRNLITKKKELCPGQVIKLSIPDMRLLEVFPMTTGAVAAITGGKHAGKVATIERLAPGSAVRRPFVVLKNGGSFGTDADYVFVIGTDKPVIQVT